MFHTMNPTTEAITDIYRNYSFSESLVDKQPSDSYKFESLTAKRDRN